jgi:hypothetical protein
MMMMLPPAWRVTVAEHDVPPRWHIPAQVVKVYASDAKAARVSGTRAVQIAAGVPPMKPLRRITYPHTAASPLGRLTEAR